MRPALALFALLVASAATADEVWVSATPLPARHQQEAPAGYHLTELRLRTDPPAIRVRAEARKADGLCARDQRGDCQEVMVDYQGEDARALLNALNSANLSSRSLLRRVLERLQADGHLPGGAIAGSAGVSATATATPSSTPAATASATPAPPEPTATASAMPGDGKEATPAP